MSLDLYDVLKNSYKSKNIQAKAFKKQGFNFDYDLSNDNEQVYFNPKEKKLMMSVAGTHNLSDVGTDFMLGAGFIKSSQRYNEAKNILERSKQKYNIDNATLAGHSLGGLVQYIAGSNDKVYTLDKAATIGQKTRSNEHAYRTSGDLVSIFNSGSTRMKTLHNPQIRTGIKPYDIFKAHDVENIKNEKIFI